MGFESTPGKNDIEKNEGKEADTLERLDLAALIPEGVELNGIEGVQKGLDTSYDNLMASQERLGEGFARLREVFEEKEPTEEQISTLRKIVSEIDEFYSEKLVRPAVRKVDEFRDWIDSLASFGDSNKY